MWRRTTPAPFVIYDFPLPLVANLLLNNVPQTLDGSIVANLEHTIRGMGKVCGLKKLFYDSRNP